MNDQTQTVANDTVVSFHYTLTNRAGEILDSSRDAEPLSYLHGHGNIVPGLEQALGGRSTGEKLKVEVKAEDGYGERRDELVLSLPRSQGKLPEGVGVGDMLELRSSDGHRIPAKILEIGDEAIRVDANHPLAGEDLFFDVELTGIRTATAEEIDHGHVHPNGHSHE